VTATAHPYGPDPAQFVELLLPAEQAPAPVVVVLHGGFWRARHGIELARPLAADLVARGFAAVAVEYRRVGGGGGWPQTLVDVATAVDLLPDLPGAERLDLADVTVVGHSAGGHLAAWVAGRDRLTSGSAGAGPRVRATAAVLQAGVLDLQRADQQQLGSGATAAFLGGGPDAVPDRYATADPMRLLPTGIAVLCVHGTADTTVPPEQSERYAAAARAAGDRVEVLAVPGDHMSVIDPAGEAWRRTVEWLMTHRTVASSGTILGS
jgi:acetyl esterase/lipase